MYEIIETLVKEDKLSFADEHNTNVKHSFLANKEDFLADIQDFLQYQSPSNSKLVIEHAYCFNCGERLMYFLEGEQLVPYHIENRRRVPTDPSCFNQEVVEVEIPVHSGELMFADRFEHANELIGHLNKQSFDINCLKMTVKRTEDYANEGMGHFFVGGSSPYIFEKENTFLIGNNDLDEDDNEILLDEEAKEIGRVRTELWWVSICDREVYENMAIAKFGEAKGKEIAEEAIAVAKKRHTVLQVEPGTYRIRYFTHLKRGHELYATIERVSESK